jgi:Fe-S-cluster-containing dehydrogenase component/CRP-like cAMP-binding protein
MEVLVSDLKTAIQRPKRWDTPLDSEMTDEMVTRLLGVAPFSQMNPESFVKRVPLRGVLKNDCRLLDFEKGDIIIREGDYGHSAFLILEGEALVSLKRLPANILGRQNRKPKGWFRALAQLWENSSVPEARDYENKKTSPLGSRESAAGTRVFLQDIPSVLDMNFTATINEGEIFGEISALTRTPRTATVVANERTMVLEIRWQGFRELMKRDNALRDQVDRLYRQNSLKSHLREIDLLADLTPEQLQVVADHTLFESYGTYDWNREFKSTRKEDISERILQEPLIAKSGEYVNGLVLVRNGFARLSRSHGSGHQTIAYLGKGETFGLRELAHNWRSGEQKPWMLSLRAVGYVDILRIPTEIVESTVLPHMAQDTFPLPIQDPKQPQGERKFQHRQTREAAMDAGLMEFLVENRFINGAQTMMIDLDRCTRCDDCVRACANAHDNNPRFIRHGPKYDHWMIANACMHCLDPVCMIGCPTGAIGRDEESGTVTINDQTCIGCSTCANSCPYSNIRMVDIFDPKGKALVDQNTELPIQKATKCDLCVDQMGGPACQRACPHDALVRIDLSTPTEITAWSADQS